MLQNNLLYLSIVTSLQSEMEIQVAVVAFPQQAKSFVLYGNTASISGSNTRIFDLFSIMTASQNVFYGINGIKLGDRTGSVSFVS